MTSIAPMQRLTAFMMWMSADDKKKQRIISLSDRVRTENGAILRDIDGNNIRFISNEVPENLKNFLLAIENHRFYSTYVIDFPRSIKSTITYIFRGRIGEGGSGIIQQIARSTFLMNDKSKTISRKIHELQEALLLRYFYEPNELVNIYIKSVYLGSGIQGFKEASQYYFSKALIELNSKELLSLVAILNRPETYLHNERLFRIRYITLVNYLTRENYIDKSEKDYFLNDIPTLLASGTNLSYHAYYNDYVQQLLTNNHENDVQTLIDPDLSVDAAKILSNKLSELSQKTQISDLNGFILAGMGDEIYVMIGGKNYLKSRINQSTIISAWKPGSLMKLFSYSYFYDIGYSPEDLLPVAGVNWSLPDGNTWVVDNYSGFYDNLDYLPAKYCLSRSLNVPASYIAALYSDSIFNRLSVSDINITKYPANLLGSEAIEPLELYRILQILTPPYGVYPNRMRFLVNQTKSKNIYFTSESASKQVAKTMSLVIDDEFGTGHFLKSHYGINGSMARVKTSTGQGFTSSGVYLILPGTNHFSVLIGVFSESNKPLLYPGSKKGIVGSSLLNMVNEFMNLESLKRYVNPRARFEDQDERDNLLAK